MASDGAGAPGAAGGGGGGDAQPAHTEGRHCRSLQVMIMADNDKHYHNHNVNYEDLRFGLRVVGVDGGSGCARVLWLLPGSPRIAIACTTS